MTELVTGIEIQIGLSPGQRTIGKILHTLHLDAIGKFVAHNSKLKFALDGGEEQVEPMYEAHFIPCAPGDHELAVAWFGDIGLAAEKLGGLFNKQTLRVAVPQGQVAQVLYTPRDGGAVPGHTAILELVGTRPA